MPTYYFGHFPEKYVKLKKKWTEGIPSAPLNPPMQRTWINNISFHFFFQVSSLICGYFRLCQTGKEVQVQEQISRLPKAKVGQSKQTANDCDGMDEVSITKKLKINKLRNLEKYTIL